MATKQRKRKEGLPNYSESTFTKNYAHLFIFCSVFEWNLYKWNTLRASVIPTMFVFFISFFLQYSFDDGLTHICIELVRREIYVINWISLSRSTAYFLSKPWSRRHPLGPQSLIILLSTQKQTCLQWSVKICSCPNSLQQSAVVLTVWNYLQLPG